MLKKTSLFMAACLLLAALAGCSANEGPGTEIAEAAIGGAYEGELAPYTIKWYFMGASQPDVAAVEEEINKITEEKINARVELHFVDYGSYDEKMQIALAAGDDVDMCFTSNFANDYISGATKGAFQEITLEQLEEFAPNMMEVIPEAAWEATRVGGKIYGLQIERVMANTPAVLLQKQYIDKYNFDVDAVESLADFTPLLQQIADNEPGVIAIDINAGAGLYVYSLGLAGLEIIAGSNPGGIVVGEENPQIVNLFETEEMREFLYLLREWYELGIIQPDAATVSDVTSELAAGRVAARISTSNPDSLANQAQLMGLTTDDLLMVEMTPPYLSTNSILGGLTAISHTSKDPERCLMLYNLLFDREDTRLMNLINYGIEGRHYTKLDDSTVQRTGNGGYYFGSAWQFGSLFNCYKESLDQPDWIPAGPDKMAAAEYSAILGFSFDPAPVKTELAQCSTVFDEYGPALFTGSVDVDEYLSAFVSKLKTAGSEKIIDEMNSQLAAWRAG